MKKKCDQLQPSCSRCKRLKVECVGGGQRRFKFVEPKGPGSAAVSERSRSSTPKSTSRRTSENSLTLVPSNDVSTLVNTFVVSIDPSTDDRFNLMGAYGQFMKYIPSRLGMNKALDASVEALSEAHINLRTQCGVTPAALSKYANALQQMRLTLSDQKQAYSTETLCAAMILSITQVRSENCIETARLHVPC
jgi:hypothetical protein